MRFCPNKSSELYKELAQLNNGDEDLATDAYTTITNLQDKGLISEKRYNYQGKMVYTVPMTNYTSKNIPMQLKGDFSKEKNIPAFEELDRVLTEQDINWIKVKEINSTYVITLEANDFYESNTYQEELNSRELAENKFRDLLENDEIKQICNI